MELHGALFFGTAETIAREIEIATKQKTKNVALDLRRVTEIDSTGAHVIASIDADLKKRGINLLLCAVKGRGISDRLADFGYLEAAMPDKIFPDVDRAIEWAEDDLLRDHSLPVSSVELQLHEMGVLDKFDSGEIAALQGHLVRRNFAKGDVIFREGSPGDETFFVLSGSASAHLQRANGDIRLATFAPGAVFGELAILDFGPRSATLVADEDLVVFGLTKNAFVALAVQTPALAIKLLAGLGRELSGRLRRANRAIDQLES
jgi:CRP-like cAMP-binding protein/ABC-type transporter Mla MlaB component